MSTETTPLTLSREELYELVWSKPTVELAKDFGISDVALAKRCRKLGVPVPGRGYWARVAAGQTPGRTALKKHEEGRFDQEHLTFRAPNPERDEDKPPAKPRPAEENALRDKILLLEFPPIDDLKRASAAVKRTANHLKVTWRNQIDWSRGEKSGPIIQIDVSEIAINRALRICERLLQTASQLGWNFEAPKAQEEDRSQRRHSYMPAQPIAPTFGELWVEGEPFSFRIDERKKQIVHVETEEEKRKRKRGDYVYAPRFDHVPTGELRLHVPGSGSKYAIRVWKDGKKVLLVDQVKSLLCSLLEESARAKVRREDARIAEIRRQQEQQRQREQSERRADNAKLVRELEAQAGAWFRARILKTYVRAVRRKLGAESLQSRIQKQPVDFLKWAEHYIDQLDPLNSTPHHADLMEEQHSYYRADESRMQESMIRLLGLEWERAWKLGAVSEAKQDNPSSLLFDDEDDDGSTVTKRPTDDENLDLNT